MLDWVVDAYLGVLGSNYDDSEMGSRHKYARVNDYEEV
jgi:hypothetical protein